LIATFIHDQFFEIQIVWITTLFGEGS